MPELRTSEDGRLSLHFGDFDESVRKISEATDAFTVHLDRSVDAIGDLLAAVSSAEETLDAAREHIDQTSMFRRFLKKTHEHLSEAIRLTAEVDLREAAHVMSARPYLCRGLVSLILSRLGGDSTDALRSAAIADLVKSVGLNPVAETYMRLAEAYVESDDLDAAMESLENATRLDINYAEAYLLKGLIHRARGEEEDAHEEIFEAISLNPDLYREEFEPIMQAERESEALWDELRSRPEFDAMLEELEKEL